MSNKQDLLTTALAKLDETKTIDLAKQSLSMGVEPCVIIEEARKGLEKVGDLYGVGVYFLADLIMAAEIFKQIQALTINPEPQEEQGFSPQIIFGTVLEDIHDIGKNIAISVMRSRGLRVYDLGVNVPPERFVDALNQTKAPILCLSGLITQAYESMKNTITLIEHYSLKDKTTVIIGGLVNANICNILGSDYWVTDATSGMRLCKDILTKINYYNDDSRIFRGDIR